MQSTGLNNIPQAKIGQSSLIHNISRTKRADTAANPSIDSEAPWRTYGMFKDTCMENSILFNKLAHILTRPQAHAKLLMEKSQVDQQASKNLQVRSSHRSMQYAKISKENRQLFLRFADCKPSILSSTQMAQGYEKHKQVQMRITRFPSNHKRQSSLPQLRAGFNSESNNLEGDSTTKKIQQEGRLDQKIILLESAKQKDTTYHQNQMKLKTEQNVEEDGQEKSRVKQIILRRRSLSHSFGCLQTLFYVKQPNEQTRHPPAGRQQSSINPIDEELLKDKNIYPTADHQSKESKWQDLILKRGVSHAQLQSCYDQQPIQQMILNKQLKPSFVIPPINKRERSSNGNDSKFLSDRSMNQLINVNRQNSGNKMLIS